MSEVFTGSIPICCGEGYSARPDSHFVLFAIELGNFHWSKAAYYLIPMTAYMAGAFVSEAVSIKLTRVKFLRWETVLVAIEILFIIVLGFIPDSAPFQISQIAINFICSMQYNTFRQAEGIPDGQPPSAQTMCARWASICTIF